jgi:hypothetical protein
MLSPQALDMIDKFSYQGKTSNPRRISNERHRREGCGPTCQSSLTQSFQTGTLTTDFALNISAICATFSSPPERLTGDRASQIVASVRYVNEGPKAGFLTVVAKAE